MYEKYLISSNQVYIYAILIAAVIGLIVFVHNLYKKKGQKSAATNSLKTFGILTIVLVTVGLQCRKDIYSIDYDTMVYDKTIKYASIINFRNFDDSTTINGLKNFMNSNNPDFAKDSLKYKCRLITSMYLSILDDLVNYVDLSSEDTLFSISNKTQSIYSTYIKNDRERSLADSIISPLINEFNNKENEMYVRLRIAKGFAEIEQLSSIKLLIRQNQDKIKQYYFSIFKEEL
jgi:hypothetical protein